MAQSSPERPPAASAAMLRTLWRLGWPLAIMLQIIALSEATSLFWFGRLLGPPALAAEATMRHIFTCASWIMVGVATGVSVLVAQSVGARDGRGLAIVGSGTAVALAIAVIGVVAVVPFHGAISDQLASGVVAPGLLSEYYVPWFLLTLPALGIVQVVLQAAAGSGWTRLSLSRSLVDLGLTLLIVPLLIEVLRFGIAGGPIALGVVQLAVAVFVWRALWRSRERLHLGELPPRGRRVDRALCREILAIGMPPQLARVAMFASYAYLVQRVAEDGRTEVVAYGIAVFLMFLAINFTGAFGRAVGIVVGQSVGARAWDRLHLAVRSALVLCVGLGVVCLVVLALLGGPLARLFTDDAGVIALVGETLPIIVWAIPCTAVTQVFLFALTALKSVKLAAALGTLADVLGVVFAITWPGDRHLEIVAWAIVISSAVRAVVYIVVWRWQRPHQGTT